MPDPRPCGRVDRRRPVRRCPGDASLRGWLGGGARRALVTGLTGQDGSFLAELLLAEGYAVHGHGARRPPRRARRGVEHLRDRVERGARATCSTPRALRAAVRGGAPAGALPPRGAVLRACLLGGSRPDARRDRGRDGDAAGGGARHGCPRSAVFVAALGRDVRRRRARAPSASTRPAARDTPYAIAKLAAHRAGRKLPRATTACMRASGILYNHESERRPERFVTRKITRAAAAIKLGLAERAARSGTSRPCATGPSQGTSCGAAWLMLQRERARGLTCSPAGTAHTVGECAAGRRSIRRAWRSTRSCGALDESLVRPAEVDHLIGDASKARTALGGSRRRASSSSSG